MRPTRRWMVTISALMLAGCATAPVTTDYVRQQALAKEVIHTMFSAGDFDAMMAIAVEAAHGPLQATIEQQMQREMTVSEHERFVMAFGQAFHDVFPQSLWEDALVPVYTKYLDQHDLEALLTFYRTPAGAKFLRVQSALNHEGAQAIWRLITTRQAEFDRQFLMDLRRGVR